jgi:hypothetical protein
MPSPHPVAEWLRALASGSALAAIGCFRRPKPPDGAGTLASHLCISWAVRANASQSMPARVSSEGTVPLSEHERRQHEQFRGGAGWPFGP